MNETTAFDLRSGFSRTNYADLSDQYQAAYDWFTSFGFNVAVTRLRRYKTCIDEMAEHYRSGTLNTPDFKPDFANRVTSMSEATEIMRIYRGLASLYSSGLKDKLHAVLSGRDGRPSPADFDPSRDIAFELLLASRCHKTGISVEIGTDADLVLDFEGTELFVECKRLKSTKNVRKLIKDALKQLHCRYKSAHAPLTARGILAFSLTDMANPDHGLMIGDTPEEVRSKVQRHVNAFIRREQNLWQQTKDKRTIGVFVELSAPCVIESENLFTMCNEIAMNNCCFQGTPDMNLLVKLAKRLAEQSAAG